MGPCSERQRSSARVSTPVNAHETSATCVPRQQEHTDIAWVCSRLGSGLLARLLGRTHIRAIALTLYRSAALLLPCCCWSRILTTSKGVTIMSASVTPAAKPAAMRRELFSLPSCMQRGPGSQDDRSDTLQACHAIRNLLAEPQGASAHCSVNDVHLWLASTHRVAQQVLVQAVGAEAQEVLEREVAGKGR